MKTRPNAAVAELRPRILQTTPSAQASVPAFTLTVPELADLMREAARQGAAEALAGLKPDNAAATLLSVQQMAERLGVSRSKVNAMRLEGCPAVRLGAIYRFSPPAVLAWLEARGDAP